MATFNWRPFLDQYSRELLADRRIRAEVPQSVVQSAWMGFDPASPKELSELEGRIGAELPDSYKQFLATSNGWRQSGGFIYGYSPREDRVVSPQQGRMTRMLIPERTAPIGGGTLLTVRSGCLQVSVGICNQPAVSDVGDSAVYF